jgi:AraC-like DNA-binding protein
MDTQPTTSATTLRLFTEALEALRVDWRAMLRSCGIDPAQLAEPEARIPQDHFQRVWIAAREWTGDPCIGLHAGERIHAHAVNLFGYLMLSSTTLGDGLRRIARYQRVLTGVPWIAIDDSGAGVRVRVGVERGDPEFRAIHAEYVAALVLQVLGWVSETKIEPREVRFEHEPRGELSEYRRFLRCPVRFSADRSELVLHAGTLDRPSIHADEALARVHEEFAERLLASEEEAEVTRRVQQAVAERLESSPRGLASVARLLGMSARTLQRRLAEEQTTFREVVEKLRRDLARDHLEQRRTPIAAVAYLTGFSDVSAFTRAVRRWFGRTPARLRQEASHQGTFRPPN